MLFILFVALFSLDVFNRNSNLLQIFLALFMHLVPVWILLVTLMLAWRWPLTGSITYLLIGITYLLVFHPNVFAILYVPVFALSLLFFVNWHLDRTSAKPTD
jgi:hypothetical protein